MIVADTSAIVAAVLGRPVSAQLQERLAFDEIHAPHLIDVEIVSSLRRLVATRAISSARAFEALSDSMNLVIVRYPHSELIDRMWELRSNLTAYDAAFVALGEALGCPVVTCDRRLARSRQHQAMIEVY